MGESNPSANGLEVRRPNLGMPHNGVEGPAVKAATAPSWRPEGVESTAQTLRRG